MSFSWRRIAIWRAMHRKYLSNEITSYKQRSKELLRDRLTSLKMIRELRLKSTFAYWLFSQISNAINTRLLLLGIAIMLPHWIFLRHLVDDVTWLLKDWDDESQQYWRFCHVHWGYIRTDEPKMYNIAKKIVLFIDWLSIRIININQIYLIL